MDYTQSEHSNQEDNKHLTEWLEKELASIPKTATRRTLSISLLVFKASLPLMTNEALRGVVKQLATIGRENHEKILLLEAEVERRLKNQK